MCRTPMLVYGICIPVGPSRFDLGAVGLAQTTLTGWGFFMHLLVGGCLNVLGEDARGAQQMKSEQLEY